ncbi:hypothetical protein GCM10009837_16150 [Streptomyces durmitorensis]|uniref:Transthyretin-like family protein n=1 Tax=Streptomyces durmitorensis TaxID=319947 RepID=A0ABY4PS07_9ACTN|nr:transthyretin-like family protein [Streptomyces durmitorensis]UQT55674.1 transthyretin-like family protein [Streptomyces durmitorensis]
MLRRSARPPASRRRRPGARSKAVAVIGALAIGAPLTVLGPASAADPAAADKAPKGSCAAPKDWSSCVHVTTRLDRAPSVGQQARLDITVDTRVDLSGARVQADLPAAVDWASAPAGWQFKELGQLLPEDGGAVHRAQRTIDLAAGKTLRFSLPVKGVKAAATSVRARVDGPAAEPTDRDEHLQLLTVGATPAASHLGFDQRRNSTALRQLPDDVELTPAKPDRPFEPVAGRTKLPKPHSDDAPSTEPSVKALSCVTGTVGYTEPGGAHPSPNIQVEAWDDDSFGADDLLDSALTDGSGGFRMCFDNNDTSGGQDVYVKVRTESGLWRIVEDNFFGRDVYEFRSGQRDDIGDGRTVDFGRIAPGDQTMNRVFHAYDQANQAKNWTPGECWDARDTGDCRRMEIVYPDDDAGDGSRYQWGDKSVWLEAASPDDRTDTVHEYGHAVMADVYEDNRPPAIDNCSPHAMDTRSSKGCAWVEGFANFYPMAIFNNDNYRGWHVEDTAGYNTGDDTEGRVTGSLWDLMDPSGERYWDYHQESAKNAIWDTLLDRRSNTFQEFWTHRGQEGHDVGSGPGGALYQNGIDYGFRNQLTDGQSKTLPAPDPQHNYRYDTTFRFWSVVALRPPAGVDYDLDLYDDQALQQRLDVSLATGDTVDFIAVDSNARGPGDYYPVVKRPLGGTGTGDYRIEVADSGKLLIGSDTKVMNGADDVTAVWDTCPAAGTEVTITATPSDASQDAELFLMDSDPASPNTAVRGRYAATASGTANGPGQAESFKFTSQGGCYGVVLVNKAGSGTYTVTES